MGRACLQGVKHGGHGGHGGHASSPGRSGYGAEEFLLRRGVYDVYALKQIFEITAFAAQSASGSLSHKSGGWRKSDHYKRSKQMKSTSR